MIKINTPKEEGQRMKQLLTTLLITILTISAYADDITIPLTRPSSF